MPEICDVAAFPQAGSSTFPGIAKVIKTSAVRKPRKKESSGGRSGSSVRGSSRNRKACSFEMGDPKESAQTVKDAKSWAGIAVRAGWDLSRLKEAVDNELHEVAIATYNHRIEILNKPKRNAGKK